MNAHEVIAVVGKDQSLVLDHLPFAEGQKVKVTVVRQESQQDVGAKYSLRGKVVRFDRPTDPVEEEAWEAIR